MTKNDRWLSGPHHCLEYRMLNATTLRCSNMLNATTLFDQDAHLE